jgi:uncharacterized membrane protein
VKFSAMSETPNVYRISPALRTAIGALLALLALQVFWHMWLAPPKPALLLPTLTLAIMPLLFSLWLTAKSLRRGVLVGGIACLFYFSHGIGELWSGPPPRWPAAIEVALALLVVFALGWDTRKSRDPGAISH